METDGFAIQRSLCFSAWISWLTQTFYGGFTPNHARRCSNKWNGVGIIGTGKHTSCLLHNVAQVYVCSCCMLVMLSGPILCGRSWERHCKVSIWSEPQQYSCLLQSVSFIALSLLLLSSAAVIRDVQDLTFCYLTTCYCALEKLLLLWIINWAKHLWEIVMYAWIYALSDTVSPFPLTT